MKLRILLLAQFGAALAFGIALTSMNAEASSYTVVHSFCSGQCKDGKVPENNLAADSSGNVFGTTAFLPGGVSSGSVVYELVRSGNDFSYSSIKDTGPAAGRIVLDTSGNIYIVSDPLPNGGAVYELFKKDGKWRSKIVLHAGGFGLSYPGQTRGVPWDGVSPLYTVYYTTGGGYPGAITNIVPGKTWSTSPLYVFCKKANCSDGAYPVGDLVVTDAGRIFGVTSHGGTHDGGVVFELQKSRGKFKESVLYNFCSTAPCPEGNDLHAGLTMDAEENLFGTTALGGAFADGDTDGGGVVFELVKQAAPGNNTYSYQVLHSLCSDPPTCSDGAYSFTGLGLDAAGNLFGSTHLGGTTNRGVVFEIQGGSYQVLHSFCSDPPTCSDGAAGGDGPGLVATPDGVFGTTNGGGTGGVTYRIVP